MAEKIAMLNDPPEILEGPILLHHLLRFDQHNSACAIDFKGKEKRQEYSYKEVQSSVRALELQIRQTLSTTSAGKHPTRQHIIPVLLPQSPGLYISQIAILQSGGAFCPITLDSPKERIQFVVRDVLADIIITTREFRDVVSWEHGPKIVVVDEFPAIPQDVVVVNQDLCVTSPNDLAYVMYTSGSSGTPKGVAVSHFAVTQSLLAHERHIPTFDRFLQFAAPSFDVSVFEIFFPLARGSTLVGCERAQLLNDLPGTMNELNIDAAELTPTVAGSLLQKRSNVPGLKLLLTIGEMLTRPLVEEFGGSETQTSILYGMYGPTEAAIHCTIHPRMKSSAPPGNIGVPLDTVSTFIVAPAVSDDPKVVFLPTGAVGELVLGGPQLAQGYMNRPEQNKAAFVSYEGKSYYRTGDKGRQLVDGTIEIMGRMSAGQIKLRGQRVEIGEIEEAVYKHPGIQTVCASVLGSVLVVFALTNDTGIRSPDVMATCAKWLPKFMMPSEVVLLQKFSYLPSGKVDKRKLEAEFQNQREADNTEATSAESPAYRAVKATVQSFLGTFGQNMRLAAVGLDSLVAIQIGSQLRLQGYNITTIAVLQAETLDVLVQRCERSRHVIMPPEKQSIQVTDEKALCGLNLKVKEVEYHMPCTPLQNAMLSETAVDKKAYRNWAEVEVSGQYSPARITEAFQTLADHNAILRTGFIESRDYEGYTQIIWKGFPSSRIEIVTDLEYNYSISKDESLLVPIRVQVCQTDRTSKLLVHLHHAVYDAWTLDLLLDDLDEILAGNTLTSRPSFALLVDGYVNNTLIVDSWASKDYWKDHLAYLDFRQLPNFHSHVQDSTGLAVTTLETSISTSHIEVAARRLSSSPQSIFQAAYALILSSYLGSSDVCFGTVFSGRTLPIPGIEDMAGPCLSTLPIRVDLSMSSTLQGLVHDLNSTNRKHLEHSAVPLREIKSASGINSRQSLFDTLVIWQQTLHKYDHSRDHVHLSESVDNLEFNLTLEVIPGVGIVVLKANYQTSLLPASQVNILLHQIEQITNLILQEDRSPLQRVFERLSDEVLAIENGDPQTSLGPETLVTPIERIAAEDPDRPAIDFALSIDGLDSTLDQISYGMLNLRANKIADYLLLQGVLPNELVCICMDKSINLYSGILATVKAGAGYLPLTPETPHDRLLNIINESKIRIIISQVAFRKLYTGIMGVKVIYLDELDYDALSSHNPTPRSSPNNAAYCVFTSGSTGTPKGVLVTQSNLISNLDVLEELYPATNHTRLLQSCSQSFDVSVFEIFFTWRIGACLCSTTKDILYRDIENAIRVLNITHLSLTPTVAALVNPDNVPGVKFLVTAGEAVTQKVFNSWAGRSLYQGYGPSETTNICTVNSKVSQKSYINNIGPPFRNTSAFVLSPGPEFSLVLRGGEGEFCFGGSQVFRGYMDPRQNLGRIIQHPKYGRLYRSGDFGRLMPDGSLAFTGRKDDQVKIRGQRVELGEISNIMLQSPKVRDCIAMIVNSHIDQSERLVCFWSSPDAEFGSFESFRPESSTLSELYKNLQNALPAYMIPSALIPVSYLPPTSQGKVDRRTLISHYHTLDQAYMNFVAQASLCPSVHSWSELEIGIREALAQITKLPIDQLHPHTSFFTLGVDSISAISFARALRSVTKREVEISDVLKHPSISRLAQKISSESIIHTPATPVRELFDFGLDESLLEEIRNRLENKGIVVQRIYPCTPLQEAMLSAGDSSEGREYHNHVTFNIKGNADRLKTCWDIMVQRHEILRTCFVRTDVPRYPYMQVVLNKYDSCFGSNEEINSTSTISPGIEKRLLEVNPSEPPWTINLRSFNGSVELVISMHHALYDGVALTVLYEEVEKLYHGESLPPVVSFAPFLQSMLSKSAVEADAFWETVLADYHPTEYARVRQPSLVSTQLEPVTRTQRLYAPYALSWIESSSRKHSTTLLAVCHTVWAGLSSERLQTTDVCFGTVVSGRTLPLDGIERLVAPCFNTIPSRLQNVHTLSYLEAFRKMQSISADSLPFQLTPLRRLQTKYSPNGSRLFDTLFILQQPSKELDSSIWAILEDDGAMDFPLVCEVVPRPSDDTLEIVLHSHSTFISSEDAHDDLVRFSDRLQAALEHPRRQLLAPNVKEQIEAKAAHQATIELSRATEIATTKQMTAAEETIRNIISDFTDVPIEKINREVSIFRLGLDSINAVQVAARLRKLGHNIIASDVLDHPTIAQLNAHIAAKKMTPPAVNKGYDFDAFDKGHRQSILSKHEINHDRVESIRPCTQVQQGMIAQSLHSHGTEYINSIWMELTQGTSLPKLKKAWQSVFEQHEMLRTGFAPTDDFQHPFVMITYHKDGLVLPWNENTEEEPHAKILERLVYCPWSLNVGSENDKFVVRFTAHHSLYDAQSLYIILSDVARLYNSQPPAISAPVNTLLGGILNAVADSDAHNSFWLQEENKIIVNKFPELTPLRVTESTLQTQELISQASTAYFEKECRQNGVTLQAAGQAAWARLLTAYVGETSTTFGITLSGRSVHEDADSVAFPSIVTLPVRCDVVGTNNELLSRTMRSNALLHKHQFTPLTSIQKWAEFHEGKIFDTLFTYQKLPDNTNEVDLPWKIIREEASVDYAVSLELQPAKAGNLVLRLSFRDDLIPKVHAELLLKQYEALLLDTLQKPNEPCNLTPIVESDLLSITPAKESSLPDNVTLLHQYVERGALTWPGKIAFEFATCLEPGHFESRSWTYHQLDQKANKVAHLLLKHGVIPGQMIAICFDKCPEASFAIVGILKAGCSYVALDPTAPNERLKFILADSGAELILTAGRSAEKISMIKAEILLLDAPGLLRDCSSEPPKLSRETQPQDVSYCLYTSGTTGTPKGCLITHENSVQAMLSFQRLFADHWTGQSKWLQFASFHFDVSVLELFWSWSVGICVASAPRDLIFEDIPGAIRQLGITHIDLTPSLARLLSPADVPSLCKGVFITGGEQLKQEILDIWGDQACIYNGYGPTEATIGVTMYPRVPRNGKPANIGPQFDNVGSFVLKPGTELPVFRGGVGELCVSGKLVGKGYLNRPELTKEKFPTLQLLKERVYRTGDIVRILHNGAFIFLGRADDQVKLRGQRLELSEINEVIKKSTSNIHDVVTLVLRHSTQQKEQLVTFFVSTTGNDVASASLVPGIREACTARLPGYMVPTHFVPIDALPLNANNKADSKQLTTIYNNLTVEDLQHLGQPYHHARNWSNNEQNIINVLAKIMQVDAGALTRGSNIFELGLDSISIIAFSRALQISGLINAKLSLVKSNPNISSLVQALLDQNSSNYKAENAYMAASQNMAAFSQKHMIGICNELGVESVSVENISPCTPVQEGIIYRFLESDIALYFNKFEFILNSKIDLERLLESYSRVVANLQILRTKFVATDDGYAQVVMKPAFWDPPLIDYDAVEKSQALMSPYKICISHSSSSKMLSFQIFHGLYDGNSLEMILRSIVVEYQGMEGVDYGPEFHSSLPYGPLAKMPGAEDFWTIHLQNWSHNPLPLISQEVKDVAVFRSLNDLGDFDELRKRLGVTPQAIIQAAWLSVLQTINSPYITLGVVTSGRAIDFEGADKVVGPLFNTVPFHVKLEPGMTSASLISECHEFNMKMQDFQHTALKDIQKWSPAKPGQSLFDTLFVFQRSEAEGLNYAKDIWKAVDGSQKADYPLAFEATLTGTGKLSMVIIAQRSRIGSERAIRLLQEMEDFLKVLIKTSGQNIIISSEVKAHLETKLSNGVLPHSTTSAGPHDVNRRFTWTKEALLIRSEIALLTNISESTVHEDSSIFELGLDSIDVIKLASRLKKRGIDVPVSVIIRSQTIIRILPKVSDKQSQHPRTSEFNILKTMSRDLELYLKSEGNLPHDISVVLPATPLQQTMVNEMIRSGYDRYFNTETFEIHEDVDVPRLEAAVTRVVEESPILRSTFLKVDDPRSPVSYAQIIRNNHSSISQSDGKSIEDFVVQLRVNSVSIAISEGALCQVHFVSASSKQYMVISISHALYDGTSLRILHEDIRRAYNGEFTPRPDFIPFLEIVFQSTTEDAKTFWRTTLSNLPPTSFPRKDALSVLEASKVHRLTRTSSVSISSVEELCKLLRITIQTLAQTCWALVLSHIMGQLDVVFGSVLSCRDTEEANEVMFPLMNTVAVRAVIHGSLAEMLKYMQDMSDATRQYQHFPLGTAQAYAMASRTSLTGDTNLFDTLFIYQGRRSTKSTDSLYESVSGTADVEFPVCVEMEVLDDKQISWTTACKASARDSAETAMLLAMLDDVLAHIIASPLDPTITTDADGISVGGLPKFQELEASPKSILGSSLHVKEENEEWSATELSIRGALHVLSKAPEESIHKGTTIFHLGLDSISVLKLPALLKSYGIKLSVSEILREQTLFSMAKVATSTRVNEYSAIDVDAVILIAVSALNLPTNEPTLGEVQSVMPVTAGQIYMIRMWQASRGALFYPTFTYTMHDELDRQKLKSAWNALLHRHDILRTGFCETTDQTLQIVYKTPQNVIVYATDSKTKLETNDLRSPPIKLVVEESLDSTTKVHLVIHHALYDGISLPILVNELQLLYQEVELTVPRLFFKPYVAQSITFSQSLAQEKWTEYLSQASLLPTVSSATSGRTEVFCPSRPISPLKELAQSSGVTIDSLLLATIAKLYAQHLPQPPPLNIVFGIYLANRAPFGEDLTSLAAPTLNLLPLSILDPSSRSLTVIAKDIQRDIQRISSAEMVGASLADIYVWTGVRVNLFVNILKDSISEKPQTEDIFMPVMALEKQATTTEDAVNEHIDIPSAEKLEAYMPSVDVEIRYRGDTIDLGVFAPANMLSVVDAEQMIDGFVEFWS